MPADHLDDELLSDLADEAGAAGASGLGHVAGCASCASRVEAMRRARALVASPVTPLAADVVDAMVTRAVVARVVAIGSRRRVPGPQWIAAVAALVALLIGVPALLRTGGSDSANDAGSTDLALQDASGDDDAAGRAVAGTGAGGQQTESFAAEQDVAPTADAAPAAGASAAGPPAVEHLGAFDEPEAIVRAVRARLTSAPPRETSARARSEQVACEGAARAAGAGRLRESVYVALADWQGRPVEVHVFALDDADGAGGADEGDQPRQAYVMAREGCDVLADPRF